MSQVVSVLFHGTAYGMVLYIISVGLSITMGLMRFVNLAHGIFAMAGGYILTTLMGRLDVLFPVAVVAAFLGVAFVSLMLERLLYSRFYGDNELAQVLFSIGLIFIAVALARMAFGSQAQRIVLPAYLQGQWRAFNRDWMVYRLFTIAFSSLLIVALWFGIERTRWGALVRASVDNTRMAQSIGINTSRVFSLTFMLGSGLAGLGGAVGVDFLSVLPTYPLDFLVTFLMVVAVGGPGSLRGTFFAALILGLGETASKYWFPEVGSFFLYFFVIALLNMKPHGLYGARA
ncbi:ABC transporter permease [Burkholderia sp. K24]|jgi:branched-chain amino acid transport system permease protein|uniref:branched-chain amino acid ABC transporter permease n=1 Tax=Paraburkholderia fungorum TaxID=134537 RepID=UPI0004AB1957|nr:branched-chain amino acid ABC transporter permease [Paraburkholderia fungorum]KFX63938.1 ABC transporter permease [Burkholderia sp. K24]MBU7436195.1 branched-chain amino acid ABC transporter permease [Paraburkholderia fungorum]